MFGEKEFIGESIEKLNKNGSIKLPEYSCSNNLDKIYFLALKNEIRLYSEEEIIRVSNILFDNLEKKLDKNKFRKIKRMYYGLLLSSEVVKNNKLSIPKKLIKKYSLENKVILEGSKNHIKLKKHNG